MKTIDPVAKARLDAIAPVIKGLLSKIARGDIETVGVLADILDDSEHPLAERVRKLHKQWIDHVDYFRTCKQSLFRGRRNAGKHRWTAIASWHRWLRNEIADLFKKKWKRLSLQQLADRNPHLTKGMPS